MQKVLVWMIHVHLSSLGGDTGMSLSEGARAQMGSLLVVETTKNDQAH